MDYNKLPVHSGWAGHKDGAREADENRKTYEEIKGLFAYGTKPDGDKVVIDGPKPRYASTEYHIVSNPLNLKTDLIALWCDGGNLCFGHKALLNSIVVYTD